MVDSIRSAAPSLLLFKSMGKAVGEWLNQIVEQSAIAGDDSDLGRHSGIQFDLRQTLELSFVDPHRRGEEGLPGALVSEGIGRYPRNLAIEGRRDPLLEGDEADIG